MRDALDVIGDELLRVRGEVFTGSPSSREHQFALYFGRMAEMELKRSAGALHLMRFTEKGMETNRFMDALIQFDYGLPEWAVCIHVDGKPYTTLSLEPEPEPTKP